MDKEWFITINGVVAGFLGINALERILEYATLKAAVFQAHLARAPELSDKVYQSAREAADKIAVGDLIQGLFYGAVAGGLAALVVYKAYEIAKEE